jgi:precorrin-6Y C5,15-methyltransferase (decarboxylating)
VGTLTVVGIGADGWIGLSESARHALVSAEVLIGSERQLSLLPPTDAEPVAWPSPLLPAIPGLLEAHSGRRICVLACGDPMFFGIGVTLTKLLGTTQVQVIPHPSSLSLACARLGWAVESVDVLSTLGRPLTGLVTALQPGKRLLVLSEDGESPAAVASLLTERGFGGSALTVLEQLGGPDERRLEGDARSWSHADIDALNVIAIECVADADVRLLPRVPGLPDDAYDHDGQLTKREVRALTLSRLAPLPGQLLWDVGAGSGSVGIEWVRSDPACRAIAIERDPQRADRISSNSAALDASGVQVVRGEAPTALAGLERPDAVFIGGGLTVAGVVEACWAGLRTGGRLVANAVTIESEAALARWYRELGGDLGRIEISRASPVGGFTGWRPAMPVTQWVACKS